MPRPVCRATVSSPMPNPPAILYRLAAQQADLCDFDLQRHNRRGAGDAPPNSLSNMVHARPVPMLRIHHHATTHLPSGGVAYGLSSQRPGPRIATSRGL